jgi:hypothetical protein
MSHQAALLIADSVACLLWLVVARWRRELWPGCPQAEFPHPWRELGFAALAAVAIVGIGMLYQRGWCLPAKGDNLRDVLAETANQLAIFSPMWVLLAWRRQPLSTVLVPPRLLPRLLLGAVLSAIAVAVVAIAQPLPIGSAFAHVYAFGKLRHLAQVLMEDLAVAMLLVRAAAALRGTTRAAIVAAVAFAAAHVPALLSNGAPAGETAALLLNTGLTTLVLVCVLRGRDVVWFFPVHWALDMTQFAQ